MAGAFHERQVCRGTALSTAACPGSCTPGGVRRWGPLAGCKSPLTDSSARWLGECPVPCEMREAGLRASPSTWLLIPPV